MIGQGGVSKLTYGLDNGALIGATAVALSDTLPADMVVADPPDVSTTCTGGTPAAGAACTLAVDVTSAVAGSYPNDTESVTLSLGTSAAATATLTVTDTEPPLSVSMAFEPSTITQGGVSRLTYGLGNGAAVAARSVALSDTLPANVSVATVSVTVGAFEVVTCTIAARSPVEETVETINSFLTRRADLILSSRSNPGGRFERLNRGSDQASPLSFSNGDLEALVPFTGQQGGNGNFEFSTSLRQARQAAASFALVSGSAGEVAYVENHRFDAWFKAQYGKFSGGADEHGDFAIAHTGVDYLLTPDVLVGALVSLDTMEELADTGTVSGFG